MPLSELQSAILRTIAKNRNPNSFIAGGSVLNEAGIRLTEDVASFHGREEDVATCAVSDAAALEDAGFSVTWVRRNPGIFTAVLSNGTDQTRLEWVRDSDFRFFPAVPDNLFGFRLHLFDIATNKALAAAGRNAPRNVIDLLTINERVAPLGAVINAAVAKDSGFTPESLIAEIRRNARYRAEDFLDLNLAVEIDAASVARRFREALDQAEAFVASVPTNLIGLVFLDDRGRIAAPRPGEFDNYNTHSGSRGGIWPSNPEIDSLIISEDDGFPEP